MFVEKIAPAALPHMLVAHPAPAVIQPNTCRIFVEPGLALRGEFRSCEQLVIAGHVECDFAGRFIEILEGGSFKGSAAVSEARVAGRYEGVLAVEHTLAVGPSAHICGSVQCGRLQREEGGKIEGELRVLADEAGLAPGAKDDAEFEARLLEAAPISEADADPEENPVAAGEPLPEPRVADGMRVTVAEAADRLALAEAEAAFRSALEADLCDAGALSGLGHAARQRGDLTGAFDCFALVIAADPQNASVRRVSVKILRALSRHAEADAIAEAVQAVAPPPAPEPAQEAQDEPDGAEFGKAEAMFQAILERHPRNLGALAGLGHLARRRGDRGAMRRYYGAALSIDPMNFTLRVEVARAFKQLGDIVEAREILETALNEDEGLRPVMIPRRAPREREVAG